MESGRTFIAFDLGAESGRCIVALLHDEKIVVNEVYRFVSHTVRGPDGLHWDIMAIFEELVEGLKRARTAFGPSFDGIGVDSWGVDYVLLDGDGKILGLPFHYRDPRTDHMMEQAFSVVPREKIYGKVGIQFAQFNTLFQLLAEKKRGSNLLHKAKTALLIPDFLNFMLSGIQKAEYSIASTTGLVAPNTRNWSWDLIDAFEFRRSIFPEIVEPGTALGKLLPSIVSRTGLDQGIPVIATTGHDTASAVVSVPTSNGNWAYLSSGTWSLMGVELKKPILTPQALEYNFTNEGGFEGTTRFLKNITGLWPLQECKRSWAEKSRVFSYQELASMATRNGYAGSWVDLDDPRFLNHNEMPDLILASLKTGGQSTCTDEAFITRVVLESLAFKYRRVMKELEGVTGSDVELLHVVGGGIQNELLTQLTADAIGRPVIAGPIEGAAIGNVGVQAIAVGAVPDLQSWRGIVADSFDLKVFEPIEKQYFDSNENKFNDIVSKSNQSIFI